MYTKPLPTLSRTSAKFWKAAKRHELCLQRCQDCGHYVVHPRSLCPQCLSSNSRWEKVSGRGTVYSYTVIRRASTPGFEEDVPYVFAIVELDEGPRMATNIVGIEPEKVAIGIKVEAFFDDVTPEITLVKFQPVKS